MPEASTPAKSLLICVLVSSQMAGTDIQVGEAGLCVLTDEPVCEEGIGRGTGMSSSYSRGSGKSLVLQSQGHLSQASYKRVEGI